MTRTKKMWIAAAVGLTLLLGGVGVVLAQTPTPSTGTGTTFLDRVAQKLGITTPRLQDAIKSAGSDQLDEAVKNGTMTQQQADALRQRLNTQTDNGNFGFGPGKGKGFGMDGGFGFGFMDSGQALADFLGISLDQLRTELSASGATLATVAQANGKSRDQLKQFITDTAKSRLDQAVKDGKITQAQEDNLMSQLSSRLDQMIDGAFGFKGLGRHGEKDMPDEDMPMNPQPSTTPQGGASFGGFGGFGELDHG